MDNLQQRQAGVAELPVEAVFDEDLILASASPRRSEILQAVRWPFRTMPVDIDETQLPGEDPIQYVERLALEKATAAAKQLSSGLVLGADTTVIVDDIILGKPRDRDEAHDMLRTLSGRWHEVATGVALVPAGGDPALTRVSHERTRVLFGVMSEDEIRWHVEHGSVLDKAGAYAVQGLAALFIKKIEGDYWNVVGLPVQRVYDIARDLRLAMAEK